MTDSKEPASNTTECPLPRRAPRKVRPVPKQPIFDDIAVAVAKLGLEPEALRARCRRAQELERGEVIARLGAGVVAYKLGRTWRFRFFGP
ncbi:MAG: hypothetical protein JW751_19565 [Polyangiaceae bacterium]|nr:hypothetical protein [Polyangiaceae bacterium]